MQGIPDELYEAAAIDGAKAWNQFWHVTVPMLRPTIIFTVIVSTIGGLQLFSEAYLFEAPQHGGPRGEASRGAGFLREPSLCEPLKQGATGGSARQYQTVVMYMYEKAFAGTQF